MPICYSCGFNEKNNKPINMCKVKTTRNKISIEYVESDSNGEIELNFCVDCVLYVFSSGEIMALNGAKMTKRYGNSGIWKQLEEKIGY